MRKLQATAAKNPAHGGSQVPVVPQCPRRYGRRGVELPAGRGHQTRIAFLSDGHEHLARRDDFRSRDLLDQPSSHQRVFFWPDVKLRRSDSRALDVQAASNDDQLGQRVARFAGNASPVDSPALVRQGADSAGGFRAPEHSGRPGQAEQLVVQSLAIHSHRRRDGQTKLPPGHAEPQPLQGSGACPGQHLLGCGLVQRANRRRGETSTTDFPARKTLAIQKHHVPTGPSRLQS